MFMCSGAEPASVPGPSLIRRESGLAPLGVGKRMFLVLFHFTLPTFCFLPLCLSGEGRGNQCQSKRGVPIMNRPNQSDTDKGWRSDAGKCGKGQSRLRRGRRTGTDLSGFDGSLKHCSERGAVISLTIPAFSLLCCNEHSLRGRLVTKHRARFQRSVQKFLHGWRAEKEKPRPEHLQEGQ